jgi:hypothetical protein
VDSIEVNKEEGKITAVGETDPVYLAKKLRKLGYKAELLSVGPAKDGKKEAEKETTPTVVYHVNPSVYPYPSYSAVTDEYPSMCIIL